MVTPGELEQECVLPGPARLREVAAAVAAAVAEVAYEDELGTVTVDSARWGRWRLIRRMCVCDFALVCR